MSFCPFNIVAPLVRQHLPCASNNSLYDDHWASKQERGECVRTYVCVCMYLLTHICTYVIVVSWCSNNRQFTLQICA